MLLITGLVVVGLLVVLPPLLGDQPVEIDTAQMLSSLNLGELVPSLSLSDIPIEGQSEGQSGDSEAPSPAPVEGDTGETIPLPAATQPPAQAVKTFSFTVGGTLIIDNAVRRSAYHEESKTYDFSQMIAGLTQDFRSDFTYVTLENLVIPGTKLSDLITTGDALSMLPAAGVDGVNIGQSRIANQGIKGLTATADALREKKLTVLGVFSSEEEATTPRLMTLGDVKVAFVTFLQSLSRTGDRNLKQAKATYAVPLLTEENIAATIQRVRQAGAQVIVANVFWTEDSKATPSKQQVAMCQLLADQGVNVIIGTGTHLVQPVTWLTNRGPDNTFQQVLCAYGLGNVITSGTKTHETASMLLHCTLSLGVDGTVRFDKLEFTPTHVWKYTLEGKTKFQAVRSGDPRPEGMDDKSATAMEKAFQTVESMMQESPLTMR